MATSIHNVLAVNIQGITNLTIAANRTFTTTRALRVFDLTAWADTTDAANQDPTVNNGANPIIDITLPVAGAVQNRLYRAGGEDGLGARLVTTCDDAQMLVASGGTIVFDLDLAGSTWNMTAYCITE